MIMSTFNPMQGTSKSSNGFTFQQPSSSTNQLYQEQQQQQQQQQQIPNYKSTEYLTQSKLKLEQTYSRKLSTKVIEEIEQRAQAKIQSQSSHATDQDHRNGPYGNTLSRMESISTHYAASRVPSWDMNADLKDNDDQMGEHTNEHQKRQALLQQSIELKRRRLEELTTAQRQFSNNMNSTSIPTARQTSQINSTSRQGTPPRSNIRAESLQRARSQRYQSSRRSSRRASTLHELIKPLSIHSPNTSPQSIHIKQITSFKSPLSSSFIVPSLPKERTTSPLAKAGFARPTFSATAKAVTNVQSIPKPQQVIRKSNSRANLNLKYSTIPKSTHTSIHTSTTTTTATTTAATWSSSNSSSSSIFSNLTKPTISSLSKSKSVRSGLSLDTHPLPPSTITTNSTLSKSKSMKFGLSLNTKENKGMVRSQTVKTNLTVRDVNAQGETTKLSGNKSRYGLSGLIRSSTTNNLNRNVSSGEQRPAWR